ncbi:hypothetical protein FACS1894176_00510 [Bacteroidia bacterium]|nr:hypothetical protein FACS189428_5930 [Clostridia bacterium]GHV24360.1 hypothetical protein FACS1894176_00510 [Bacteroidia bacterium]
MNRKPLLPSTQADVRKILGVCAIVFLALIWRGDFVGEEEEKVVQIDYLATGATIELPEEFVEAPLSDPDKVLEEVLPEILQIFDELDTLESALPSESYTSLPTEEEHEAANNFSKLCTTYASLCDKTVFKGTFKNREKADYFDQITTIITDVDKIAQKGKTLEDVFSQILVNQTKGNRRGSSGRSKLTMNLGGMKYDDEFRQVFTHEVGHIMDLGALQGKNSTKSTLYTEFGKKAFALDDPSLEYYKYSRQSETIRKS